MKASFKTSLLKVTLCCWLGLSVSILSGCSKDNATSLDIQQPTTAATVQMERFVYQGKTYIITALKVGDSIKYIEDEAYYLRNNLSENPNLGIAPDPFDNTLYWLYTSNEEWERVLAETEAKYADTWDSLAKENAKTTVLPEALKKVASNTHVGRNTYYYCYKDKNFLGQYIYGYELDIANLGTLGFNDVMSSAEAVSTGAGGIIIYEDANFSGRSWVVYCNIYQGGQYYGAIGDFVPVCIARCFGICCGNANDKASSVKHF